MNPARELAHMEGWSALDIDPEAQERVQKEAEEAGRQIASMFYHTFRANEHGRWVLEYLIKITLLVPTVRSGEDAFAAGIREGRADIVRQIMQQIELAEE